MSVWDWIMLAAVGAFVAVLAWSYRATTPFFRDLQPSAPKPTPKPAGPYRVAGEREPVPLPLFGCLCRECRSAIRERQIVARTVVSPPDAPARETVLHLSPAARRDLGMSEALEERDEASS